MKRDPSVVTADASPSNDPFLYADYVRAKQSLHSALAGPPFYASVTGPSGTGKTCLVRQIKDELDRHRHNVVYLSSSRLSGLGLVCLLAQRLHLSPRRTYLETVHLLADALASHGSQLLLWVDEADQVPLSLLQEVRMLAEPDLASLQSFSVVLSGLPSLLSLLDSPSLFSLKRRIAHRIALAGLTRDELDPFLCHRFALAPNQRLSQKARDQLFERTCATPALVDSIVRQTLARSQGENADDTLLLVLDTAGL